MSRKTVKLIAILIVLAMVITSFSMLGALPSFADERAYDNGRTAVNTTDMSKVISFTAVSYAEDEAAPQLDTLPLYIEYIREHYKDDVNEDLLIKGAFAGVMNALDDPYSEFYSSNSDFDNFTKYALGEYEGIGIVLQLKDGRHIITDIVPNSPAHKAGLKTEDILVSIDDIPIFGKTSNATLELLRGAAGSRIQLIVERKGKQKSFSMYRELIKERNVSWNIKDDNIGYIKISQFDSDTDEEFAKARDGLKSNGINRYIIDLRNNPGGVMGTAMSMLNGMISEKRNLTLISRRGLLVERFLSDGTGKEPEKAVVLINENTASAAEIVAAALKENGIAKLVGARTFGKGVGQEIMRMSTGEAFKLSTMYFQSPLGNKIDKVGVEPDYPVVALGGKATPEENKRISTFAPMRENKRYWKGESGLNVYAAQQRLAMLGYAVKPTGVMDDDTVSAVRTFQGTTGLYPYGVLDYSTIVQIDKYIELYSTGQLKVSSDPQYEKALELIKQ